MSSRRQKLAIALGSTLAAGVADLALICLVLAPSLAAAPRSSARASAVHPTAAAPEAEVALASVAPAARVQPARAPEPAPAPAPAAGPSRAAAGPLETAPDVAAGAPDTVARAPDLVAGAFGAGFVEPAATVPIEAATPETAVTDGLAPSLLLFATARDDLGPAAQAVLLRAARRMRHDPELRLVLRGHADQRGDESPNDALSRRRALAAKAFLIRRGVSPDRLAVEAMGEARPLDVSPTAAALRRNRRVELEWRR